MKFLNNKAQALVEYVLIIALVSVIIFTAVNFLGAYIKDSITKTSCSLVGQKFIPGNKVGEGVCQD